MDYQGFVVGDLVSVYWQDVLECEGYIALIHPDGVSINRGRGEGYYTLRGPINLKSAEEQMSLF